MFEPVFQLGRGNTANAAMFDYVMNVGQGIDVIDVVAA